jgi:hypothetical protein
MWSITMRVAAYVRARADTARQEAEQINEQFTWIREWAASNSHDLVTLYQDRGLSVNSQRPAFDRMTEKALDESHPYDGIAVDTVSCLLRDHFARVKYQRTLELAGVKLFFARMPAGADDGKLIEQLCIALDVLLRNQNSARTSSCTFENVGTYNGGQVPPAHERVATNNKARSRLKMVISREHAFCCVCPRCHSIRGIQ